ncbi:MAG: AP-4-A phosphorylase [Lentisphaerae bacterium ADurb.Bin242]|nr:MAG: AP-4-A phosphorylase [Lentisphaerae bacterium ADurb.Bin242]
MTTDNRPLWAPWRIEFIRSEKESGCFLCDNHKEGNSPLEDELIVARYSLCFVILNRYPYNSGHLLVAPYRHVGDIALLEKEELYQVMDVCVDAKNVLQKLMSPAAYNIGFNLGAAAGAGVAEHLHMHIVPRWNGDTNFMSVLSDTRVVPEALVKTAELIRGAWKKS